MDWTRRAFLTTSAGGLAGLSGCTGGLGRQRPDCFHARTTDERIGFVGDVMLGRRVTERWADRDPAGVWGSTLDRLQELDGLCLNLECCLSNRGQQWPDKTFYFRADPEFAVPALERIDTSLVALANNHVLDYREPALADTLAHLDDAGLTHAGAGPDLDRALDPAITDVGECTVAMVSFTDRFSEYAAGTDSPGTAYTRFDPTHVPTRVLVGKSLDRAAAVDPDLVVASLHWGPNWETAPGETQRAFARWLVDRGVDVVHGHSAHVLQGVEVYEGRPIIYDAGDFVDDYTPKDELHNKRSALFELGIVDGELGELRVIPVEIENEAARLADGDVARWVRDTVDQRSSRFETRTERVDDGLSIPLGSCETATGRQ